MHLGERLKTLRQRMGVSQRRLGRQLGVTDAFVSQLEQGKRTATRSYYRKYSQIVAACDGLTDSDSLYEELLVFDFCKRDPELFAILCSHYPVPVSYKSCPDSCSPASGGSAGQQKSLFGILSRKGCP
jgi:transcriptional regulator with XRE-family HTH domain